MIGLIERFRDRLPVTPATPIVSLGEGSTPLLHAPRLGAELGVELYLKLEGQNPTGSFKDRGMTLALSKALEDGAVAVVCASTGNTSASAAAYAARAGLRCSVVIPRGAIALGKLAQAQACGARVVAIDGSLRRCARRRARARLSHPITLVNNLNPYRLEGQKTAAFEIVDELGDAPDWLCLPVGNGGNIAAYWRGFRDSLQRGDAATPPRLLGCQAAGAAPLVHGIDGRPSRDDRDGDPDRPPGALPGGEGGRQRVGGRRARRDGRADPRGLQAACPRPRACSASRPRRRRSRGSCARATRG